MTIARFLARVIVAVLLAASLLPIPDWIASERTVPWYPDALRGWALGAVVCVGLAAVLAWWSARRAGLWREGALAAWLRRVDPIRTPALVAVALAAFVLYLGVAIVIFDRRPLLIDEVVFLFQARTYAAGRLFLPVDPDPAFRSMLHLVEHQGRWFGHFPPGWPALLAIGELVRAPWLIGPLTGAVAVGAWGMVLRSAEESPSIRAGAMLLFAAAPFVAFMAGSYMNHTATLMWLLVALAGWLAIRAGTGGPGAALLTGLAFGLAAATRPGEAMAFGLPAAGWALGWAHRNRRYRTLAPIVVGAAVPVAAMLLVNRATTGDPWLSAYQLLWGQNQSLGFHPAPSGPDHTVPRGLELVALYLLRLNRYLFEAPLPGLLAAGVALLVARRWNPVDRYLLAASGLVLAVYFAYWHDGFYLGPRFVLPLVPVVVLWTVRLPSLLRAARGARAGRVAAFALAIAGLGSLANGIPLRAAQNAAFQPGFRFDPDQAAVRAGITDAIIFVRESWGAQLLARLWALGASRSAAERYYRNIDSCQLDHAVTELESSLGPDLARLEPLMVDSARLVASPFSPDTSERVLDGARYDRVCRDRIVEDRGGTALLAPTLLSRRADLLYVRDLHGRNRRLLTREPTRSLYLLRRAPDDSIPRLTPLSRDSVLRAE